MAKYYWSSIGDHDLDFLCDRLGPLMKFCEQENPGTKQVHLNLADKLHNKEMVEFGPQHEVFPKPSVRRLNSSFSSTPPSAADNWHF